MLKVKQSKLSSHCPRAVKHHSLLVPRDVSAHAHVYKIDLEMQIGYIQFHPTVLEI